MTKAINLKTEYLQNPLTFIGKLCLLRQFGICPFEQSVLGHLEDANIGLDGTRFQYNFPKQCFQLKIVPFRLQMHYRVAPTPTNRECQTVLHPPTTALHRRFSHKEYYQNSAV